MKDISAHDADSSRTTVFIVRSMTANQYSEKLNSTNRQLAFQYEEKEKRAAELLIANKELVFQNEEKEKRAAELLIANKELLFQNSEKEKRAAELLIANHELAFQNKEKEKRAIEQTDMYDTLKKAEDFQEQYIQGLEEMMFMISHKIRQPVAHILGLSNMLCESVNSVDVNTQVIGYIKQSAISLDNFTRQMTAIVSKLAKKK